MKYKEWLSEWLYNYVQPSSKDKTYSRYSEMSKQHIIPKLGEYELEELKPRILQRFVTELLESGNLKTKKGLSASSVNSIISVVQGSLRIAFNLEYSKYFDADKIKRPKIKSNHVTCFMNSEQKKIEQAALNSAKPKMFGVVLCLYTGIRVGELLALEWKDIDFNKGELSVTKTCHDGKVEGRFGRVTNSPKTNASYRTIPIPKQIIPYLKELKTKTLSKYVISNGEKTMTVRSYQRSFESLLQKLKISHKGFHSLRHTFATRALECGMDVKTLSEILGHKNPTITLTRYAHSMPEHKKEMMNRLGRLF